MQKSREILENENLTCCILTDSEIYKSTQRGVKPLLTWLNEGCNMKNASCADKVVGKAAAYLYVLLGVKRVWAGVISEKAVSVFDRYGITYGFDKCVPSIINREGNGFCPMESAVGNIDDPEEALFAIKEKLRELAGEK